MVDNHPVATLLADAVAVFRGNPFTDSGIAHRARLGRLLLTPPAAQAFRGALRGSVPFSAEDLVLAIAHARACALLDPKAVLSPAVVPDDVLAELPRARQDYTRVALAAGRCFRTLQALPGASAALGRVRRLAWARAFGTSLVGALDTEPLRRAQPLVLCGEPGTGRRALARAVLSGLPAPNNRPPWATPNVADWQPGEPRPPAAGLLLPELPTLSGPQLQVLADALRQSTGPRLALIGPPWPQLAPRLPPALAARLAPLVLALPPLRERPEDVAELARARLVSWGRSLRETGAPGLDHDPVLAWFERPEVQRHGWPGNHDEVHTAVQALVLGTRPALPSGAAGSAVADPRRSSDRLPTGLADGTWSDRQVRDWYLQRVHRRTGAVGRTASILGLDRATIRLRLRASEPR